MRELKPKKTNLEEMVEEGLKALGLPYIFQHPTRTGFVIDFALFLNGEKIALEVDGPYHDDSKRKKQDRFKDYMLRREGWKVVRIHWSELEKADVITLIKSKLQGFME